MSSRRSNADVGIITFTVRDTKEHVINCIVWGPEQFIDTYDRAYKVGDIIAVYHPTVSQKNENSSYRPRTSSPFELTVNENKAFFHRFAEDSDGLLMLRNQTIKSTSLTLHFRDLDTHPESEQLNIALAVLGKSWNPTSAKNCCTFECISNVITCFQISSFIYSEICGVPSSSPNVSFYLKFLLQTRLIHITHTFDYLLIQSRTDGAKTMRKVHLMD